MAYGEPVEIDDIDLNSQWISDTTDDEYKYFKSDSYEVDEDGISFSQCKVTWSNLTSVTFKYMSNSSADMGILFVLKMDSEKFTNQTPSVDIYQTTEDKIPGKYNEFTIECDEGEHHIWFCYLKNPESATDEDRGFIGVPKYVSPVIDVKQGAELPTEYKSGGVSVEGGKTYNINFNNVALPNGNIVPSYEDYTKTEKAISYEYVDLGLSVKWAKCNVGASSETEGGVFFQWGETNGVSGSLVGKYSDENYSWASYTHCNGSSTTLKKYNNKSSYGTVDNKTTLETVDDAATQIMGSDWRMPTQTEFQELYKNTIQEWVKDYNGSGVNGRKFTSKTDKSKYIFIPASGSCNDGPVSNVGKYGHVWSSSLNTSTHSGAWSLYFSSIDYSMTARDQNRYLGYSVRGVHA